MGGTFGCTPILAFPIKGKGGSPGSRNIACQPMDAGRELFWTAILSSLFFGGRIFFLLGQDTKIALSHRDPCKAPA
jgi:hypothetical protein